MKLLIILYHLNSIGRLLGEQGSRVAETLHDIRSDIAYLRDEIDKDADDEATGV